MSEVTNEITKKTMNNILIIGSSGVGKSTLINTIFDKPHTEVGEFGGGKTQTAKAYENTELNYRAIDTKGLELGFFQQRDAIKQVKNYIKTAIKEGEKDASIDVIWYCVDASGKRFFKENVSQILNVYKSFPNAPVIIVLTKSYCSEIEREQNEKLIRNAIKEYDKKEKINLWDVVSVNSAPLLTANNDIVEIFGIGKLIDSTNAVLPEAKKLGEANMFNGRMQLKAKQANLMTMAYATGASVVGAVPVPIADSLILVPMQTLMIKSIAKKYGVGADMIVTAIFDGTVVTSTARLVLSALKAIPGINIAAAALNAVVAGVFTAAIGEATIFACDKIARNEIKDGDNDKIKEVVENKVPAVMKKVLPQLEETMKNINSEKLDKEAIKKIIESLFKK